MQKIACLEVGQYECGQGGGGCWQVNFTGQHSFCIFGQPTQGSRSTGNSVVAPFTFITRIFLCIENKAHHNESIKWLGIWTNKQTAARIMVVASPKAQNNFYGNVPQNRLYVGAWDARFDLQTNTIQRNSCPLLRLGSTKQDSEWNPVDNHYTMNSLIISGLSSAISCCQRR